MNAMEERIRSILSEHQEQNCYLIYRLEQGAAQEPAVAGGSVRFLDGENGKTLYAVRSIEEFQALYQPVKDREGLILSLLADGTMLPQVLALDDSLVGNLFHQLTAPKAASLPETELSGISSLSGACGLVLERIENRKEGTFNETSYLQCKGLRGQGRVR